MMLLILSLSLALISWSVIIPLGHARRAKAERIWRDDYRWVKLRAVKRYYPELRAVSDEAILQRYNLTELYNSIGR